MLAAAASSAIGHGLRQGGYLLDAGDGEVVLQLANVDLIGGDTYGYALLQVTSTP